MYLTRASFCGAVLVLVTQQHVAASDNPILEVQITKEHFVVGEPIVVDFVVRNESQQAIRSGYINEIRFSEVTVRVMVYSGGNPVARWGSYGTRWDVDISRPAKNPVTGQWHVRLEAGRKLHARKLLTALVDPRGFRPYAAIRNGVPLPPGRYILVGSIPWIEDSRLESDPVQIEIVDSRHSDERHAAELVNEVYVNFMGGGGAGMRMGMKRMDRSGVAPLGSVKRILDEFPNSIHARLARSRLLVLQAKRFVQDSSGTRQETTREQRKSWMLEMVKKIGTHLQENPDDPLELALLQARVKLLHKFAVLDPLNRALDELIAKYPQSGHAEKGRKMKEDIARYQAEQADEAKQAAEATPSEIPGN